MSAATEVIAEYTTQLEAEEALNWLRQEGVEGSIAVDVEHAAKYPILGGGPVAPTRVLVLAADAVRARAILAKLDQGELQENWEDAAESAIQGWMCPNCDTEVNLEEAYCPECGSPRTDVRVEDGGET